jgi:hypothetical protein
MRWCCFSLLVAIAVGYSLGAMTEPPQPRQSVVCTILQWIEWFSRRPRQDAPQSYQVSPPAAEPGDGYPMVDHYGSI